MIASSPFALSSSSFGPRNYLRLLLGPALFAMLAAIFVQEACGAATTWLVIRIARDITENNFTASHFGWIVLAQLLASIAATVGWIFAERTGFRLYARYMLLFARSNRHQTTLLGDAAAREQTEPFLTDETFHVGFELIFTLQFQLRLILQLLFNTLVLGIEIDGGLPLAFAAAFIVLAILQWQLRKPLAAAYLHNQRMTNHMTARTYTAWDNVFSGNRYNFAFWHRDFRARLQTALAAQLRAIMLREGWSAASGLIALVIVLATTAWIAVEDSGNIALLIALAATLPRQIEMTLDLHQLTAGFTDLLAVWTRIRGVCEHTHPAADAGFVDRIGFDRIRLWEGTQERVCRSLADAVHAVLAVPTGLVSVRGGNGSGKSTLLAALKAKLRGSAYYWPTHDRLAFSFNTGEWTATVSDDEIGAEASEAIDADELSSLEQATEQRGYSSGERQLRVLREIVAHTDHAIYLLDEWDANIDDDNRLLALTLIDTLASRARVVEISHRDRR